MSKENKKLIKQIQEDFDQDAPSTSGITLQEGLDRSVKVADTIADRASNNETDIFELNSGNFDVNGDGSKITSIFDANGDLISSGSSGVDQAYVDAELAKKVDKTDHIVDLAKKLSTPTNDAAGKTGQLLSKALVGTEWVDYPLDTDMIVTFDDGTTVTYKVGK